MRKLLPPFTVTPLPIMLFIVKGARGMLGNGVRRVIVNRLVGMSYPGSLVGMLKSMVVAAEAVIASMIACRRLPAPASAVLITVGAACELITPNSKHIPAKPVASLRILFTLFNINSLVSFFHAGP